MTKRTNAREKKMAFSKKARNNTDRVNASATKLAIAQRFYTKNTNAEYGLDIIRLAGKVREACHNARGAGA